MKLSNVTTLAIALMVLALPLTAMAQSGNILENGMFETGDLTGWQVFGESGLASAVVESPDNGPSWGGSHNVFLDNMAETTSLLLKQTTPVGSAMGGTVWYSADLKLDQADVGGVVFMEVFAEQSGVGIVGTSGLQGPFWPWNEWQQFQGSFEAPAGTDFLTIQIMANTGAATGTNCRVHVDNAYLGQVGEPVANEASSWSGVKALFN